MPLDHNAHLFTQDMKYRTFRCVDLNRGHEQSADFIAERNNFLQDLWKSQSNYPPPTWSCISNVHARDREGKSCE